jgi:hypothetical protein
MRSWRGMIDMEWARRAPDYACQEFESLRERQIRYVNRLLRWRILMVFLKAAT